MTSKDQVEILLVEDDPDDLELTMHALNAEHVCNRIRVARDGEEALDLLFHRGAYEAELNWRPAIVFLDLKLPKVDGLEVLEQIKRDPDLRAVPVVILTSSKQEQDLLRGYRLGANSYIQKPVDFEQFRSTIKELGYYWLVVNQKLPTIA